MWACSNADTSREGDDCPVTVPREASELVVAGSGAGTAPLRAVAATFTGAVVRVSPSIGTGGAVHALVDGAIDIGVATRPITAAERARGVEVVALARIPLAFVVHRDTDLKSVATQELVHIYSGATRDWSDGTPIVALMRQRGDSTTKALALSPRLAAAWDGARLRGTAVTLYTDGEMRDALLRIPGAIGVLDAGTMALENLPMRPLRVDGLDIHDPSYPYALALSLLTRPEPSDNVRAFVQHVGSSGVRTLLRNAGYQPWVHVQ